jgi:hypothetical protein
MTLDQFIVIEKCQANSGVCHSSVTDEGFDGGDFHWDVIGSLFSVHWLASGCERTHG